MSIFRRLPTRQLLTVIFGAVLVAGIVTAVAIAAIGSGPVPPPKQLDAAIKSAIDAPPAPGVTARITLVNHLIDSGAVDHLGSNPLLSGGDGRLWVSNDGRVRLELFSSRGDPQLAIDGPAHTFSFYDPSSNTAYQGTLPSHSGASASGSADTAQHSSPTLKSIDDALAQLAKHANVSSATATDIARQAAYSVRISPKADAGGMVGGAQIAWDAVHGIPLDIAIFAKSDPANAVLELKATQISFTTVSAGDLSVTIPSGAKVVHIDSAKSADGSSHVAAAKRAAKAHKAAVTGLAAVRAALPFALSAPPVLDNLTQSGVRELTVNGHPAALVTYGEKLGTVAVLERAVAAGTQGTPPAASSGADNGGGKIALPTTSVNGANATVLPTALGTIVSFERQGVSYTIAGSVPRDVAVAIARGL